MYVSTYVCRPMSRPYSQRSQISVSNNLGRQYARRHLAYIIQHLPSSSLYVSDQSVGHLTHVVSFFHFVYLTNFGVSCQWPRHAEDPFLVSVLNVY